MVAAGRLPPRTPDEASVVLPLTGREQLAIRGPGLTAEDRDMLTVFVAQLASALGGDRLHAEAAEAESLAKANELRSALLAAVSHDLRTPLSSIKAAASSLLSDQLEFGPEETRLLLQTIDDESDRLNSLVENLLDMSRLQTESMEVLAESADVGELVVEAVESLGPRGVDVAVTIPPGLPRVHTDPVLVERAVANLVDNALSHAGAAACGSRPVPWPAAWTSGSSTRARGSGAEDRDVVFQPFQRLGDSENGTGVGLGLAVARGFVRAVGGELDLEDTPGGGCTMVVRLPVAPMPRSCRCTPTGSARRPGPRRTGRRRDPRGAAGTGRDAAGDGITRVLVIDDDASLVRALSISLTARGYDVAVARNGEEGLDRAAHRHPDVILLDLGLPGIDGVGVIRGIRGWSTAPIIVLSARHQSVSKVDALDAGADDYVTKPFGMDELLARLRARSVGRRASPRNPGSRPRGSRWTW